MGVALEKEGRSAVELRSPSLRTKPVLKDSSAMLVMDAISSMDSLVSVPEGRAVFGRESVQVVKVQAGVRVGALPPVWRISASPREARFSGRIFDSLDVLHRITISGGPTPTTTRTVQLRNGGLSTLRLRLLSLHDPTTAHFGSEGGHIGAIGLNAFGRGSHAAMDEAAVPKAARVIGCDPPPDSLYMTNDVDRARDFFQKGDLPDSTAGMSGQVLILSLHEFELQPQRSFEVKYASVYSPDSLEEALSKFKDKSPLPYGLRVRFTSSSETVSAAFEWAVAAMGTAPYLGDSLEALECLRSLGFTEGDAAARLAAKHLKRLKKDGSYPHPLDSEENGFLEASLLVSGASRLAVMRGDKKAARASYPALRRASINLLLNSGSGGLRADLVPQGWRRSAGRSFPSGELSELDLAVSAALDDASVLASFLGKRDDAARFKQGSLMIETSVRKRLVDESGTMALNIDAEGRVFRDVTVDQAIGCWRHSPGREVSSNILHRLAERDFETGYGPRTVPTTNRLYFNGSYAEGQVGGFWTRASLACALLAYGTGLATMGSLGLQKVAKLVVEDLPSMGGLPGCFPFWVDVDKRQLHGLGSDPVAASRYVETVLAGEAGVVVGLQGAVFMPPEQSKLNWLLVESVKLGGDSSIFVGRSPGGSLSLLSSERAKLARGESFSHGERIAPADRLVAFNFYGPCQYLAVGNPTQRSVHASVAVPPRVPELSKRLTADFEEFDQESGGWKRWATVRVLRAMTLDLTVGPGAWRAFRVSTSK